jgi:hypothetical protein
MVCRLSAGRGGGPIAGCKVNRRHDFHCPFLAGLYPWARASASLMNFPLGIRQIDRGGLDACHPDRIAVLFFSN